MEVRQVSPHCLSILAGIALCTPLTDRGTAAEVDLIPKNRLFKSQYSVSDRSFCNASVCLDFDGDGTREILFASRKSGILQMLSGAAGQPRWSRTLAGDQQSLSAFDLDGDGSFEILYTVSSPGRLYLLNGHGETLRQWDSGDHKLGHSPVVIDADGDGHLDGLFGTRSRDLVRLGLLNLTLEQRRPGWRQCGCYTSAMDVDHDGHWDLFAGSGDDSQNAKGVIHRYDPRNLQTIWSFETNDNASSADPVLVDIDGDGQVEVIKSVDNYGGDDAHDAIYAFETNGRLLWRTAGFSGEDSPNVADLDGDGEIEIIGMTFGCEVYCLDAAGQVRWRKDLRPELSGRGAHAYMAPILCDLDGDAELEILALTNGGYFETSEPGAYSADGIVFALSAAGEVLDSYNVGGHRYWGEAFVCNVDDDPWLELVASGSGGLDVIETRGFGPATEHFQRRRSYQRLNVVSWDYSDTYFIERGKRSDVKHRTDNLVLKDVAGSFVDRGTFTTDLLALPPGMLFDRLDWSGDAPQGTEIRVCVLGATEEVLIENVAPGKLSPLGQSVRLRFEFLTERPDLTPLLDSYRLSFRCAQ